MTPVAPGPRALLVGRGGFSGSNERLLGGLRRVRPDLAFDVLDLDPLMRRDRITAARCVLGAVREYGPGALRTRALLRYRATRNVVYDNLARRAALNWIGARDYAFSLQTQSLFDAATDRFPHFVYTDYAALARVGEVWDDGRGAPSAAWLARERRIYAHADHVFTFGSGIRQLLIDTYGVSPARVSRAGAGASVTPSAPPSRDLSRYARRNVLFVGVDWARKGGPDLLAAFRLLRARLPDATLTIVGCKPPEAEGLEGCVALGRLPPVEVERHFQAASLFCMPTRLEPFGVVFCEAAHFALPVVATTVGDVGDVVRDGENGFRVAPGAPEVLADALFAALADPAVAQRMGAAGAALAHEFTWDAVARAILARAPLPAAAAA